MVFWGSIAVLYILNLLLRCFVWHDNVLLLIWNFAGPIGLVGLLFAVNYRTGFWSGLLFVQAPKAKMAAFCVPLVAAALHDPHNDNVDIATAILATYSLCITPYIMKTCLRTCIAIVIQAIMFVMLSARLGGNVAAMLTIVSIAVAILLALLQLECFFLRHRMLAVQHSWGHYFFC